MKTIHWIQLYGGIIGILILIVSVAIYLYLYGRIIRVLKRLDMRYVLYLVLNSYIFTTGLFLLMVANGWI